MFRNFRTKHISIFLRFSAIFKYSKSQVCAFVLQDAIFKRWIKRSFALETRVSNLTQPRKYILDLIPSVATTGCKIHLRLVRPRSCTNVFGISARTQLPNQSFTMFPVTEAVTLRNFISYARLIICRSFTHVRSFSYRIGEQLRSSLLSFSRFVSLRTVFA